MSESKYVSAVGVPPVKVVTMRAVRRRVRRAEFDELAQQFPPSRTAVERWDFQERR